MADINQSSAPGLEPLPEIGENDEDLEQLLAMDQEPETKAIAPEPAAQPALLVEEHSPIPEGGSRKTSNLSHLEIFENPMSKSKIIVSLSKSEAVKPKKSVQFCTKICRRERGRTVAVCRFRRRPGSKRRPWSKIHNPILLTAALQKRRPRHKSPPVKNPAHKKISENLRQKLVCQH